MLRKTLGLWKKKKKRAKDANRCSSEEIQMTKYEKKKKNRSTSLVVQENGILFFPIKVTEGFGFLFVLFLMIIHNITRVQGETSSHCWWICKIVLIVWKKFGNGFRSMKKDKLWSNNYFGALFLTVIKKLGNCVLKKYVIYGSSNKGKYKTTSTSTVRIKGNTTFYYMAHSFGKTLWHY